MISIGYLNIKAIEKEKGAFNETYLKDLEYIQKTLKFNNFLIGYCSSSLSSPLLTLYIYLLL